MRKAFKSKLSGPKQLVRKVLSKTSSTSHDSTSQNQTVPMTEEALLANEIGALKDQIENLKAAISALQDETEDKEVAIARLAREKEKISLELLKLKRSNSNLAQQLEDERNFYFKEKEIYCQEMNECKKLKKLMSSSTMNGEEKSIPEYKAEIFKLKHTLNQTLEANYNLSIKFLRMKNTKTCLKTELRTMRLEHEKLENDYKTKIENLSSELNDLVNEKLKTSSISPSNKKYLQLVKQNSCLVYENLCLQLEVDNLNLKFEKLTLERTKSETNSRLKYINHDVEKVEKNHKKRLHRDPKKVRIQETPEKLEKEPKPSCSRTRPPKDEKIVKIYERIEQPGIPDIKIINEKQPKPKEKKARNKILGNKEKCEESSSPKTPQMQKEQAKTQIDYQIKIDDTCRENFLNKNISKLALFQVSDMQSVASSDCISSARNLTRSESSPNIVLNHKTFQKDT